MNPKKPRRWRPLLPTLLVAILVTTASMPSAAERTLVEPAPGPSLATPVNPALDHQRDLRVDDHAAPRVDNHVDLPFDRPLDRPLDLPFDRPLDSQLAQLADPMRGRTPVADESVPPPLHPVENKDLRRERAYSMQPPTIPHKIDGYQVDKRFNRCLDCHAREKAFESRAVPLSVTHYMDRTGNVLGEVSPRRYFCTQCHVSQVEAKPLVPNDFRDIADVLRTGSAHPPTPARKP